MNLSEEQIAMTTTTTTPRKIYSMIDIRRAAENHGSHWFSPDALRFFNSRISNKVYNGSNGVFFVSSEKYAGEPRRYTVREFCKDLSVADAPRVYIETVNEFNALSRAASHRLARQCAGDNVVIA